jgi:hypothetical protein
MIIKWEFNAFAGCIDPQRHFIVVIMDPLVKKKKPAGISTAGPFVF